MGKVFHHLTRDDRLKIEALFKAKHSPEEVAEIIGVHVSTIYREKKRGTYEHTLTDLTTEIRYSPDKAEEKYRNNLAGKGPDLKIGKDHELANYIENRILNDNYSPAAVLGEIKHKEMEFKTTICVTTLYSYIDKGIFLNLTNSSLPVKKDQKRPYKRVQRQRARAQKGDSIEKRPEEVEDRKTFGHWEMDTVVGKQGISKKSLLVLTERKTRKEHILGLKKHTAENVNKALNRLERQYGAKFYDVFKTITVDNGSEFQNYEGLEKALNRKGSRTKVYYCHPYRSCERGSNENQNRMIRRQIPKGTDLDKIDKKTIEETERWINEYPRRLFDYASAEEMFKKEIEALS